MSFLMSLVALVRLVRVVSRLVRQIWSVLSSLVGAVMVGFVPKGRDEMRVSLVKRCMRCAEACSDSSNQLIQLGEFDGVQML
ncbi:hypothetical protein F5148DRAFT_1208318 [Russula earlei]|uniref:Uncharacterized protein n=1 Tax=Russula earlei TaxID=71964 RepID=A0ACC0U6B6_9AGAM|nr:hypothetical protein F5148DRAFT_1208318 [Russula earlei]